MNNNLDKKNLELFSKEQHKKHIISSIFEGAFALTPFVALIFGVFRISSMSNNELMAPSRWGLIHFVLIFVSISYFAFLFFIGKDIKIKLSQK